MLTARNLLHLRLKSSHIEVLAIIAFLLADCLLDGWALNFLTTIAVFLVAVPALRTMVSQTALERVTFLKAYVKTRKVQRVAIVLFWIHAIRFLLAAAVDANLLYLAGHTPSLSGAFLAGSQAFEFFAFLASPVLIYLGACMTAIFLRSRLKATKEDPDLIKQRQKLAGASHVLFTSGFIASILSITCSRDGPAYMISNWLLASARDANIYGQPSSGEMIYAQITNPGCYGSGAAPVLYSVTQSLCDYSFVTTFDAIIIGVSSIILLLVLWQPTMRLHALLTSFCWRVISPGSLQNMIEAFLEALHLPGRNLDFRQAHPLVGNAIATTVWLAVCYFSLFWLFGFCGGPLGEAIQNWMIASALDAGIGTSYAVPDWLLHPNYRIFIASMIALYGTPILAVFNCVFLPYAKARKIVINADGISFAQGPYLSLLGRQFRLWSDLESLTVKNNNPDHPKKAKFTLKFRSGGKVEFDHSQINGLDLRILLEAIDEHSVSCTIAAEVFKTVEALAQEDIRKSSSDGGVDSSMASPKALEFKSTIFIPHASGEYIPGTKTRISRQVASKPLCAVYLARDEQGRMVNVKQFYLADQTEQTRAFAKILRRECELLSRLDHPGFARVLDCFTVEDSTYLVIQHRPGSDLRALVNQHGPRSEAATIKWAEQLCKIMIHLHSREPAILHRDLTPDNIISGEDGQLRLIDFGAAREFLEGVTGTMIGKQCYVSPEQLRGDASPRSDVYSFGCTLYFLLTGRDPLALSRSSPAKTMDCSAQLDQLIMDCTELDEEKRLQSFPEILERIKAMDRGLKLKLKSCLEPVNAA